MAAAITTLNSLNDLKEALQLQDVALAYRADPTLTTASHLLEVMKLQPDEDSVWPFGNSVLWQLTRWLCVEIETYGEMTWCKVSPSPEWSDCEYCFTTSQVRPVKQPVKPIWAVQIPCDPTNHLSMNITEIFQDRRTLPPWIYAD